MKTVLIAEDEKPARELLKMALDWKALGFAPPIEASNGKQAWALYTQYHPDFVITDIQMPVMDGLELIQEIKADNPHQRVVILSCHESFSYAQQAIRMGVMDYIIKDSMNPDVLAQILLSKPSEEPAGTQQDGQPGFLKEFLQGTFTAAQLQARFSLPLQRYNFICCALAGKKGVETAAQVAAVCMCLRDVLHTFHGGDVCWGGENLFYVCAFLPKTVSAMEALNLRTRLTQMVLNAACAALNDVITLGVSTQTAEFAALPHKLTEAKTALQCFVFWGRGKVLYYDKTQTPLCLADVKTLNLRVARIKQALLENACELCRSELVLLYEKDLSGMMQYNYLVHVNTLLLSALTDQCLTNNIPFEKVFGSEVLVQPPEAAGCETVQEMLAWYLARIDCYFACILQNKEYVQSPRVQKICAYIRTNFNQDISLETIADHFRLHKVYLAKIFKTEMGCSVNEYIRNVKAEKAKELLGQNQLKISAIVEMLGYNNPQTFYNVFRSCVGVSPKEYRKHILEP